MSNPAPAKMPDLSAWLTKQQAADILQVSTKSIEKFAADAKLQAAKRKQTGRPDAAVYHPDDVERLRLAREPAAFAVSRLPEKLEKGSPTPSQTAGMETLVVTLAGELRELRLGFQKPEPRLFLTVPEAVELSGLPEGTLRGLLQTGALKGMKTGRGWRIRRRDLRGL